MSRTRTTSGLRKVYGLSSRYAALRLSALGTRADRVFVRPPVLGCSSDYLREELAEFLSPPLMSKYQGVAMRPVRDS